MKNNKNNNKKNQNKNNKLVTKLDLRNALRQSQMQVMKYVDTLGSLTGDSLTTININFPVLGATQNASIGEKFRIHKIECNLEITANSISSTNPAQIRFIVAQSLIPLVVNTTLSLGTLLQDASTATIAMRSAVDYESKGTVFSLLHDEFMTLGPYKACSMVKHYSWKPKIAMITYTASTTTYNKGYVTIALIIDNVAGANWNVGTTFYNLATWRLWFTDVE
jgi:hypothetical protein